MWSKVSYSCAVIGYCMSMRSSSSRNIIISISAGGPPPPPPPHSSSSLSEVTGEIRGVGVAGKDRNDWIWFVLLLTRVGGGSGRGFRVTGGSGGSGGAMKTTGVEAGQH